MLIAIAYAEFGELFDYISGLCLSDAGDAVKSTFCSNRFGFKKLHLRSLGQVNLPCIGRRRGE